MPPRDDHEDTRREQAADIAGIKADVRGLDVRIKAEHEYIESVSEKAKECCRTAQELEVQAAALGGRVDRIEGDVERGSERMSKIETRQDTMDARTMRAIGALAALGFIAPFVAALVAKLLGW